MGKKSFTKVCMADIKGSVWRVVIEGADSGVLDYMWGQKELTVTAWRTHNNNAE